MRALDELGLAYTRTAQFKLRISSSASQRPATAIAQIFIMAPGLHMVDFQRGQCSDFLAFYALFSLVREKVFHVIDTESPELASRAL